MSTRSCANPISPTSPLNPKVIKLGHELDITSARLYHLLCEWHCNYGQNGISMAKFKLIARAIGKRIGMNRLPPNWTETLQKTHGIDLKFHTRPSRSLKKLRQGIQEHVLVPVRSTPGSGEQNAPATDSDSGRQFSKEASNVSVVRLGSSTVATPDLVTTTSYTLVPVQVFPVVSKLPEPKRFKLISNPQHPKEPPSTTAGSAAEPIFYGDSVGIQ